VLNSILVDVLHSWTMSINLKLDQAYPKTELCHIRWDHSLKCLHVT